MNAQAELFAAEPTPLSVDTSFKTAKRMALDEHSWVEVVTGWVSGSYELLDRMMTAVPWLQHDRVLFSQTFKEPRLTAGIYDLEDAPSPALVDACNALSQRYGLVYDGLWLNFYRSGTDSSGWHRDRPACRLPTATVPVLTLGATRRFLIKPYKGGKSLVYKPQSGDLIVMGGRAQIDWAHCVPKEPGITEPRVSVNFQSSMQTVPRH